MNETDKLIEEQWKTLPPNLQRAIDAVPWKALAQEIGKTNTLDAEQIVSLEQETMFIIYGFENPNDYVSNITKNIGISEEIAYTIAESVVAKIFDPILKKSEEKKAMAEEPEGPIVITKETKKEALEELSRRSMKSQNPLASVPEIAPSNLPMVEPGEVAHDVAHAVPEVGSKKQEVSMRENTSQEVKTDSMKVSLPDYRYGGADPYREPLK